MIFPCFHSKRWHLFLQLKHTKRKSWTRDEQEEEEAGRMLLQTSFHSLLCSITSPTRPGPDIPADSIIYHVI